MFKTAAKLDQRRQERAVFVRPPAAAVNPTIREEYENLVKSIETLDAKIQFFKGPECLQLGYSPSAARAELYALGREKLKIQNQIRRLKPALKAANINHTQNVVEKHFIAVAREVLDRETFLYIWTRTKRRWLPE